MATRTFPDPATEITRVARKTADQTVNNSTTLVDCTGLKVTGGANELWAFLLVSFKLSNINPDIKFGWTVPVGTTMTWAATAGSDTVDEAGTLVFSGSGPDEDIDCMSGIIQFGATGGDAQFQFAQNALEVSDTKVLANSHLIAWKLS